MKTEGLVGKLKFKKIYLEITNQCNLSCHFCSGAKRKAQFMTEAEFESIIQKIRPHTNYIYMHILGEPLLHQKLDVFMDICHAYDMKTNITTNGTLIKRSAHKLIKPALRQINFSLHALSANDFDGDAYIQNIFDFIEIMPDHVYANFRFWNMERKSSDDFVLIQRIKEHFHYNGDLTDPDLIGNGVKVSPNVYLQQNVKFTWPDLAGDIIFSKGKCYGLKDHIGILVDGTVVPCCLDANGDIPLGNIHEETMDKILDTKRVWDMKNGFGNRNPIEALCKTCGFAKRLNG